MQLPRQRFVLFLTLFLFFVFNFNEIYTRFFSCCSTLELSNTLLYVAELLTHLSIVYIVLYALSYQVILLKSFAVVACFLSTISLYTQLNYGTALDENLITTLLSRGVLNNYKSMPTVIDFKLCVYIILFSVIPLIVICMCSIKNTKSDKKIFVFCVSVLLIFSACGVVLVHLMHKKVLWQSYGSLLYAYSPVNYTKSFYDYFSYLDKIASTKRTDVTSLMDSKLTETTPQKIILVIGESARADHFFINGYERETSPKLSATKNLISFVDVSPCYNSTDSAVSCLLSRQTKEEITFPVQETSIISIFNKLHFQTYWFSKQGYGPGSMVVQSMIESKKWTFHNRDSRDYLSFNEEELYDSELLSLLKKTIAKKDMEFIILHTNGSHFPFKNRYPREFAKYTPECDKKNPSDCDPGTLVNSYDNTILYTDHFLSEAINILKDQDAILFYVSDHGLFLGENDVYYHGNINTVNEKAHRVPMFLWMSDSLLKNEVFADKFKIAQEKTQKELSHDNLFYSILDCSNIEFTGDRKDLSVYK